MPAEPTLDSCRLLPAAGHGADADRQADGRQPHRRGRPPPALRRRSQLSPSLLLGRKPTVVLHNLSSEPVTVPLDLGETAKTLASWTSFTTSTPRRTTRATYPSTSRDTASAGCASSTTATDDCPETGHGQGERAPAGRTRPGRAGPTGGRSAVRSTAGPRASAPGRRVAPPRTAARSDRRHRCASARCSPTSTTT